MPCSRSSRHRGVAIALIVSLSHLLAFANVDPKKGRVTTNPSSGNSYTIEQEVDYGRKAIPEIEKDLPLLPVDHPISNYIDKLGHKLVDKAPGHRFPYTFRVVKQKQINAFALPGGPISVNIGTIQAGSEAELAGVMAHEIAHLVMRHSTRYAPGVTSGEGIHSARHSERCSRGERRRVGRVSRPNGNFDRCWRGVHQIFA